jgi:hypothetical protein
MNESPQSLPPRALSRPGALPLWALISADGKMIGVQTFADGQLPAWSDGRHYLPVFGHEPEADLAREYFMDSFEIQSDRVVRTRTVHDRAAA